MNQDKSLREELVKLLEGGQAHADFKTSLKKMPFELQGKKPAGAPHSAWEELEHMRIAQSDILEFSRDATHVSPEWPKGYWPTNAVPPDEKAWDKTVRSFQSDLKALVELVKDSQIDLFAKIPHAKEGQTILREAMLAADHNAYHLGQLVQVRKMLGAWDE